MKRFLCVTSCVLAGFLATSAHGQPLVPQTPIWLQSKPLLSITYDNPFMVEDANTSAAVVKWKAEHRRLQQFFDERDRAAQVPAQRARLVAHLMSLVEKGYTNDIELDNYLDAMKALGQIRAVEAIPLLLNLVPFNAMHVRPFRGSLSELDRIFPAVGALDEIGEPALPGVVEALATSQDRALLEQIPLVLSHLTGEPFNQKNPRVVSYASEYQRQAKLLRALAACLLPALPQKRPNAAALSSVVGSAPPLNPSRAFVPPLTPQGKTDRLARIFAAQYVLASYQPLPPRDTVVEPVAPSPAPTEADVVVALAQLADLHAVEALPLIMDKLEQRALSPRKRSTREEGALKTGAPELEVLAPPLMAAEPAGWFSPIIANAAQAALRRLGPQALPGLIKAISQTRRSPEFQRAGLRLVRELTGSPERAQILLLQAAQEDESKARRLNLWLAAVGTRNEV